MVCPPARSRSLDAWRPVATAIAVLIIEMEGMTLVSDVRQTGVPEWDSALFEGYLWLYRQVLAQKDWQRMGNAPTLADLLGNHGAGT